LGNLQTKPGAEGFIMDKYLVNSEQWSRMQVEMARQRSPGRFQQVGATLDVKCMQRKQQSFFAKSEKTRNFGQNMDFWEFGALFFWMTSA
jgi:hypothetical protein